MAESSHQWLPLSGANKIHLDGAHLNQSYHISHYFQNKINDTPIPIYLCLSANPVARNFSLRGGHFRPIALRQRSEDSDDQTTMGKTRVGVLVRESLGGKKTGSQSADLSNLTEKYFVFCKKIKGLIASLQHHHNTMMAMDKTRTAVSGSYCTWIDMQL